MNTEDEDEAKKKEERRMTRMKMMLMMMWMEMMLQMKKVNWTLNLLNWINGNFDLVLLFYHQKLY